MRILLLFILFILSNAIFAQRTISGQITDAVTNEPIKAVNITTNLKGQGATTDKKGKFELVVFENATELTVSHINYKSRTIAIDPDQNFYTFSIQPIINPIDELVITHDEAPHGYNIGLLERSRAATIITADKLESGDETIITNVLNQVPGVYMHSGALNTNRITIRGIGSRSLFSTAKIRAYLNDIPLTSGVGETTIEDIDMNLLEKVEVIKGSAASLYGAGLGGTILMESGARGQTPYQDKHLMSKLTIGSFGLIRSNTQLLLESAKGETSIHYDNTHSDGYRDNNEYDRQSFTAIGKYYLGENNKTRLSYFASYIDLKAFIPSSLDSADFIDEPTAAAFTWGNVQGNEDYTKTVLGANLKHDFSNTGGRVFYNSTSLFYSNRNSDELRPFNILQETNDAFGARTTFSLYKELGENTKSIRWDFGAEYFRENYDWSTFDTDDATIRLSDNEEVRDYYNLFTEARYKVKNWTLVAGLNLNQTQYTLTDLFQPDSTNLSGDYQFELMVSPRLGAIYKVPLTTQQGEITVFANISHGFSPPTLEETLTPDGQINPDIQPEQGWNFELGSRGFFGASDKGLGYYHWYYDVSFFTMQVQDLLVARRTDSDAFVGINAGKTVHNGAEFLLQYKPLIGKKTDIDLTLTYTLSDFKFSEFVDEDNDYAGNELTGVPRNILNTTFDLTETINTFKIGFNASYQYIDQMPMRDDNSIYSDAYDLVHTKLTLSTSFNKIELTLFGGINNVFDEKYASMILVNAGSFGGRPPRYFYPGLPRHYYGGVNLKWGF